MQAEESWCYKIRRAERIRRDREKPWSETDLALEAMGASRRSVMSLKGGRVRAKCKEKILWSSLRLVSIIHYLGTLWLLVKLFFLLNTGFADCAAFNKSHHFDGSTISSSLVGL